MRRIKLVVSYDGTAYCGWQLQPNGVTIEEVLNKALSSLLKEDIQIIGESVLLRRAFFQLRLLADCIERFQKDIVNENCHGKEPEPREDKTELADGINV